MSYPIRAEGLVNMYKCVQKKKVKLLLKIDLVSYPARAEWLGKCVEVKFWFLFKKSIIWIISFRSPKTSSFYKIVPDVLDKVFFKIITSKFDLHTSLYGIYLISIGLYNWITSREIIRKNIALCTCLSV